MPSQPDTRRYSFSIPRVLLCGVLLSALVAVCLYLHHTAFDFYRARLLDDESKTLAWFTREIGYALPFIVICLFHFIVYHRHDRRDGVARREMMWEIAIVALFTYAVLLPYLSRISDALYTNALAAGEVLEKTDGGVEITLLMQLHEWFIRLTIPLVILLVFHAARARREILCPESEAIPAPGITVEAYEAQKAAAEAARTAENSAEADSSAFEEGSVAPEHSAEAASQTTDTQASEEAIAHE